MSFMTACLIGAVLLLLVVIVICVTVLGYVEKQNERVCSETAECIEIIMFNEELEGKEKIELIKLLIEN